MQKTTVSCWQIIELHSAIFIAIKLPVVAVSFWPFAAIGVVSYRALNLSVKAKLRRSVTIAVIVCLLAEVKYQVSAGSGVLIRKR